MEKPYIVLNQDFPGITSLFLYDHQVASRLTAMGQTIMRRPGRRLSVGDRELIAAFVSKMNDCRFCQDSHAACAEQYLGDVVNQVLLDCEMEVLPLKIRSLLAVAVHVTDLNREDLPLAIQAAKIQGATDQEIWDTILVTSFFSMANRLVDGAGTTYKLGEAEECGERLAKYGYQMTIRRFFAEVFPRLWSKFWGYA